MSTLGVDITTDQQELRAKFEALANDSHGFRRSRKGNYVNPNVARDWKWFQLGHKQAKPDHFAPADEFILRMALIAYSKLETVDKETRNRAWAMYQVLRQEVNRP